MKKFFALLLLAAMTLTLFAACGETDTDTGSVPTGEDTATVGDVLGHWVFEMNLSDFVPGFGASTEKLVGHFDFNADGTARMYFRKAEISIVIERALRDLLTIEFMAEQTGVSVEKIKAELAKEGTDWETYLEKEIVASLDSIVNSGGLGVADDQGNLVLGGGKFKLEKGKLYMTDKEEYTEEDGAPYRYADGKITLNLQYLNLILTRE